MSSTPIPVPGEPSTRERDEARARAEREAAQAFVLRQIDDFELFAKHNLKIIDRNGVLRPFIMNRTQRRFHERCEEQLKRTGRVRKIVLKARQMGLSTYIQARYYWRLWRSTTHALQAFILTHRIEATNHLFGMAERFQENMPEHIRPALATSNAKELIFADTKCGYAVDTAGAKEVGRSQTFQLVHSSEVAFWDNAQMHVVSLLTTALSKGPGSESIIESTANGVGNVFHRYWQAAVRGDSAYEAEFFPWFWDDDYKMDCPEDWVPSEEWINYAELHGLSWEQLYWAFQTSSEMAKAISEPDDKPCTKFMQEYPATADEAFQTSGNSFIPSKSIYIARKNVEIIGRGPVILGVDPARGGATPIAGSGRGGKTPERTGDKVGLIDRCGRRLGERICERMDPGGNLTFVSSQVARIIDRIRPDAVNIDVGGNGAAIYDNLLDWGYGYCINAVNFGSNPVGRGPTGEEMYYNRRSEMWDLFRDWLESEGGVRVPDTDDFQQDATALIWGPGACRHNSNNELVLEEKDQVKKRLGWSPDLGDASALTFAVPMSFLKVASQQPPPQRRRSRRTGY